MQNGLHLKARQCRCMVTFRSDCGAGACLGPVRSHADGVQQTASKSGPACGRGPAAPADVLPTCQSPAQNLEKQPGVCKRHMGTIQRWCRAVATDLQLIHARVPCRPSCSKHLTDRPRARGRGGTLQHKAAARTLQRVAARAQPPSLFVLQRASRAAPARPRRRSHAAAHAAHRRLHLRLPRRVGLKHVLDERLADRQQLRELPLDLRPGRPLSAVQAGRRKRRRAAPSGSAAHGCSSRGRACSLRASPQRATKTGRRAASGPSQAPAGLAGRARARARPVSSRLLERGATMTLACSASEKLAQVISGSTYCSRISLWLIAPGLV